MPERSRGAGGSLAALAGGGLVHSLGEGTDSGQLWFLALIGVTTLPALLLLIVRWGRTRAPPAGPGDDGADLSRATAPGSETAPGRCER